MAFFDSNDDHSSTTTYEFHDVPQPSKKLRMTLRQKHVFAQTIETKREVLDFSSENQKLLEMTREGKMTQEDCDYFNERVDQKAAKTKKCIDSLAEMIKVNPEDTPEQVEAKLQVEEEMFPWLDQLFSWLYKEISKIFQWIKEKAQWCIDQVKKLFQRLWSLFE